MIQVDAEHRLSIHLLNSSLSGKNDIHTFTKIMKICKAEATKPGFKKLFDDEESELILEICKEVLPNG